MILRFLNIQGLVGIAAAIGLLLLLANQWGETRHWKKQSGQYERLYRTEQIARAGTIANYRAAAEAARAADRAAADRVAAEQRAINERSNNALELRLADARARYDRLLVENPAAAAARGRSGAAAVPALSAAASGPAQGAAQDRLPDADRLTATEQAIQLDELIRWVRRQSDVRLNAGPQR